MQFVLSSAESLYSVQSALLKSLGEDERFFDLKIKYENRLKNQAVFVISIIGLIYGAP